MARSVMVSRRLYRAQTVASASAVRRVIAVSVGVYCGYAHELAEAIR